MAIRLVKPYVPRNVAEPREQWDPATNYRDRFAKMPIITPAYPCMNSSFNVSESSRTIMLQEFMRGKAILDRIFIQSATAHSSGTGVLSNGALGVAASDKLWNSLFAPSDFFGKYPLYLAVDMFSYSVNFDRWKGYTESRLRKLVELLETDNGLETIHLHPIHYEHVTSAVAKKMQVEVERKQEAKAASGGEEKVGEGNGEEGEKEEETGGFSGWCFFIGLQARESTVGKRKNIQVGRQVARWLSDVRRFDGTCLKGSSLRF